MAQQHKPHFIVGSDTGPRLACECGWQLKLQPISLSPLCANPFHTFFQTGFDIGREYERHVQGGS